MRDVTSRPRHLEWDNVKRTSRLRHLEWDNVKRTSRLRHLEWTYVKRTSRPRHLEWGNVKRKYVNKKKQHFCVCGSNVWQICQRLSYINNLKVLDLDPNYYIGPMSKLK